MRVSVDSKLGKPRRRPPTRNRSRSRNHVADRRRGTAPTGQFFIFVFATAVRADAEEGGVARTTTSVIVRSTSLLFSACIIFTTMDFHVPEPNALLYAPSRQTP